MDEKRGLKALETWAKRVTSGYNDVKITDMSSSWRNGLGFCAIVHHYRPDLIDFDSLSKENILHNNSLAFSVAEKQLGVPALLDAEDMEKFQHLDRLSIITYLSQLYNFFENQNKLNKKPPVKRILSEGKSGPPSKISTSELNISTGRKHDVCQTCKHRVYILERLIVSGKLYHRTCFKCCRCGTILKPGAYVEGETEGMYECATCPQDETSETDSSLSSVEVTESALSTDTPEIKDHIRDIPKLSLLTSSVDMARNSFLKRSLSQQSNGDSPRSPEHSKLSDKEDQSNNISSEKVEFEKDKPRTSSISVRERISAFECNGGLGSTVPTVKTDSDRKVNRESTSLESSTLSLHSASDNESPTSTPKSYQSLFRDRSPRPLSRLRLDIPTRPLSEFNRRFSTETLSVSSLSPGLKTSDSAKSFNLNSMPIIKSPAYSLKTLPRQNSLSSVASKEVPSPLHFSSREKINSEECLNSIIHDRWGRIRRRGSLDHSESSHSLNRSLSSFDTISEKDTTVKSEPSHKSAENLGNSSKTPSSNSVEPSSLKLNDLSSSEVKNDLLSVGNESISSKNSIQPSFQQDSFLPNRTSELSYYRLSLVNKGKGTNVSTISSSAVESESTDDTLNTKDHYESSEAPSAQNENEKFNVILTKHEESKTILQNVNITLSPAVQQQHEKLLNTEVSLLKKADETEDYPDDLNPFGDEDDEVINESCTELPKSSEPYPDDLNPFGDSDEESSDKEEKNSSEYDESMNPFASDDDDESVSHSEYSLSAISRITPVPAIRTSLLTSPSSVKSPVRQHSTPTDSPTGSLRGTLKKRQAPKPPSVRDIFRNESVDFSSPASLQSSPSLSQHSLKSPSPKLLKSKPAPPPPPPSPNVLPKTTSSSKVSSNDDLANSKQLKDMDNFRLKSSDSVVSSVRRSTELQSKDHHQAAENREWKKKKRPAPPVPIPRRREIKKIPLREILSEMTEIELKQEELEKQGRELELQIRDKDKDEEPTVEEEELIMQLFELVNQKNALFRRQAELMYIKRSQKLEEEQADLEFQIRCLMQKPASQKTEADAAREDRLVQRLLDVVDQRNEIIDSIEMDRRREAVEDSSVQEQMDVKNSDLTITAEIKEKGMRKNKKKHKDKKKKKNQDESKGGTEEKSPKSSHHKRKWF